MRCAKCGNELNENDKFCGVCGAAVSGDQTKKAEGRTFLSPAVKIAAAGCAVLVVLAVVLSVVAISYLKPKNQSSGQSGIDQEYMDELQIAETARLAGAGPEQEAAISDKIEEADVETGAQVNAGLAAGSDISHEIVTEITEEDWHELERIYVSTMSIPLEFDCTDHPAIDIIARACMGDYALYCPGAYCNDPWDPELPGDPKGRFAGWESYFQLDADACDWIVQNIYHVMPDRTAESEEAYYKDGFYYVGAGGMGGPDLGAAIVFKEALDQGKYYVKIAEYDVWDAEDSADIDYQYAYLIVDLELIDGKRIWTFYRTGPNPFDDMPVGAESAYADFLENYSSDFDSTPVFYLACLDDDTVPELIVIDGDYHAAGVTVYNCENGRVEEQGCAGGYGYVDIDFQQGVLITSDAHMGCEFFSVDVFRDGRMTREHLLEASNLDYVEGDPYYEDPRYEVDGVEVAEEQFENSRNELLSKYHTTMVDYGNGHVVSPENMRLLRTDPKIFYID